MFSRRKFSMVTRWRSASGSRGSLKLFDQRLRGKRFCETGESSRLKRSLANGRGIVPSHVEITGTELPLALRRCLNSMPDPSPRLMSRSTQGAPSKTLWFSKAVPTTVDPIKKSGGHASLAHPTRFEIGRLTLEPRQLCPYTKTLARRAIADGAPSGSARYSAARLGNRKKSDPPP